MASRSGKNTLTEESGIISQDQKKVEILSSEQKNEAEQYEDKKIQDGINSIHTRLEEEIKKQMVEMEESTPPAPPPEVDMVEDAPSSSPPPSVESEPLAKKYTIQLGSYRSRKDAEAFAQGFIVRGYQAIIREVDIPSKGTWFRVSLGTFDTTEQAEQYIKEEESLFQEEDYIIRILL